MTVQSHPLGPPPDNDDCANAFPLGPGTTALRSVHWTTDGFPEPGLCGGTGDIFQDGWYEYVAPCTGTATFTLDGDFATRILVYGGDCDDLVPLACSADTGCGPGAATVSLATQAGSSYFLRVGGCGPADSGSATLTSDCQDVAPVPALPEVAALVLVLSLAVAGARVLSRR